VRVNGQGWPGQRGQGSYSIPLGDQVMTPTHAHRIMLHVIPRIENDVISVDIKFEVDGEESTLATHRYTEDDLANAYEQVHHRVHGFDARGLDPREGPTRLKP
jgi:hypothetical protein